MTTDFTEFPWARRNRYMRPCLPMEGDTIYNTSYLKNCEDARRCNYKRPSNGDIISMNYTSDGLSVYGASYEPTEGHIRARQPPSAQPVDNIGLSHGPMAGDTINKMSYPGWADSLPPLPVTPAESSLLGRGPMSSLTTTRHDFTPKTYAKVDIIVHDDQIELPLEPMEGKTTSTMSYKEPDKRFFEPAQSFAPMQTYEPSQAPAECNTINRMSYTGAQPCQPIIIASRLRPPLPPLTEEERSLVCDPGTGQYVPGRPSQRKRTKESADCTEPKMDFSRPQENGAPMISPIKGSK